jgi:hypothetical protein
MALSEFIYSHYTFVSVWLDFVRISSHYFSTQLHSSPVFFVCVSLDAFLPSDLGFELEYIQKKN